MKSLALRYGILIGGMSFLFTTFVACGSQLYQVSMSGDTNEASLPPEATDPESTVYGIHSVNGWVDLPIQYQFGERLEEGQRNNLSRAMNSWEKAVGKKLFALLGEHTGTSGDSFKDLYSSLKDTINGHYLDFDWTKTKKSDGVLATTIWDNENTGSIASADIRFNGQNYNIGDSFQLSSDGDKEVVDMESLALHELGHLLGLSHVDEHIDPISIMNKSLFIGEGLASRKLSRGDIERIQTIYGCHDQACDVDALVSQFELYGAEAGAH